MTESKNLEVQKIRRSDYPIDPLFLNRWSPRSMTGASLEEKEVLTLLEAARWAPSSYNEQPWRFAYALKEDARWDSFLSLLVEANQSWAKEAAALLIIVSKKTFEKNGKFSKTHSFDVGSAWGYMALQGSIMGLVVHGIGGFNYEKAHTLLGLSDDFQIEAMAAIGKRDAKAALSKDLKDIEKPSLRKPLKDLLL